MYKNAEKALKKRKLRILTAFFLISLFSGVDQANLLSTWKGLIKDAYESLAIYSRNYDITDMRAYPYDSAYIYSNTVQRYYIEYNSNKYYLRSN